MYDSCLILIRLRSTGEEGLCTFYSRRFWAVVDFIGLVGPIDPFRRYWGGGTFEE